MVWGRPRGGAPRHCASVYLSVKWGSAGCSGSSALQLKYVSPRAHVADGSWGSRRPGSGARGCSRPGGTQRSPGSLGGVCETGAGFPQEHVPGQDPSQTIFPLLKAPIPGLGKGSRGPPLPSLLPSGHWGRWEAVGSGVGRVQPKPSLPEPPGSHRAGNTRLPQGQETSPQWAAAPDRCVPKEALPAAAPRPGVLPRGSTSWGAPAAALRPRGTPSHRTDTASGVSSWPLRALCQGPHHPQIRSICSQVHRLWGAPVCLLGGHVLAPAWTGQCPQPPATDAEATAACGILWPL